MLVASARVSGAVFVVFFLPTITFVLLTVGAYNPPAAATALSGWTKAGGWVGVATAAWYASFAGMVNATFGRIVLPTLPARGR